MQSAIKVPDLRNTKRVSNEEFHRLVLNVYQVPPTWQMIGTLTYSVDWGTQTCLPSLLPQES